MSLLRYTYGADFDCVDDITLDWRMTDPRTAWAQAQYRRLVEGVESLFYAERYGIGIHKYVLETDLRAPQVALEIRAGMMRDERNRSVSVESSPAGIAITIVPDDPRLGFRLVLEVSELTGDVLLSE